MRYLELRAKSATGTVKPLGFGLGSVIMRSCVNVSVYANRLGFAVMVNFADGIRIVCLAWGKSC